MRVESGDLTFIAVPVTAILLIFVFHVDAVAVKVIADLVMTYWAARLGRASKPGYRDPGESDPGERDPGKPGHRDPGE